MSYRQWASFIIFESSSDLIKVVLKVGPAFIFYPGIEAPVVTKALRTQV